MLQEIKGPAPDKELAEVLTAVARLFSAVLLRMPIDDRRAFIALQQARGLKLRFVLDESLGTVTGEAVLSDGNVIPLFQTLSRGALSKAALN